MRLRRYLGEGLSLAGSFIVLGLVAFAILYASLPIALHFRLAGVLDNLAQAIYLARAQVLGFGLPVTINLPQIPVECDGTTLTASMSVGNLTASASEHLRVPIPPFRAYGGSLTFYPDGRIEVGD